jgi:hypothetical protein
VFYRCSIKSICFPPSIEIFCTQRFEGTRIHSMAFAGECWLTRIECSCFRCSSINAICVPRAVEVLCSWCFAGGWSKNDEVIHSNIEVLTFEPGSRLWRIGSSCFSGCCLRSLCIPSSVTHLGKSSFKDSVVGELTFGHGSRLTHIQKSCFLNCSLHIPWEIASTCPCSHCHNRSAFAFGSKKGVIGHTLRSWDFPELFVARS